jgi:menaquinone-9 beta-reductase
MLPSSVDVTIVGAGTSGAAAAAFLAEQGARVLVVERRELGEAGARWINGVPRASFAEAGVALPGRDESLGEPMPFHLVAEGGRVCVREHDLIDVDMRKLVARLQERAAAAGALLEGGVTVRGRDGDVLDTSAGRVRSGWIVDASGISGARLLDQPPLGRARMCTAQQEVREVADPDAAAAYFAANDVAPGEVLAFVGLAGGFSVLNVRLHPGGDTMGILTGSMPGLGFPSARAMLDDFVARHTWVGKRVFGGGGAIPLGRSHHRLADDRVALVGDSGCQVFPAHGSGIGAGMIAARLLADTIARRAPLRDYEVAWQRRYGGLFAAFEAVRRWNQSVDGATIGLVMALGLADQQTLRAGIDQVLPRPSLARLPGQARALLGQPALVPGIVTTLARSAALKTLYAAYPQRADRVPTWGRGVDWLLGDGAAW